MSKYNLSWDENKMKRYISEGRGQGRGQDYKPWITVRDFPSGGISSRQPGWKSNRVYHFLSNNELRYFFLLEWCKRQYKGYQKRAYFGYHFGTYFSGLPSMVFRFSMRQLGPSSVNISH